MALLLEYAAFEGSEQGEGTHAGQYITHAVGEMDVYTSEVVWLEGYLTTANGDQTFFKMTPAGGCITGGTGRFEGATGSGTDVMSDVVSTFDPVAGTITIAGQSTMTGTITY